MLAYSDSDSSGDNARLLVLSIGVSCLRKDTRLERNKPTVFKDFFTWYPKDWLISGARSRLSIPARALYLEMLFLAYVENGLENNKAVFDAAAWGGSRV